MAEAIVSHTGTHKYNPTGPLLCFCFLMCTVTWKTAYNLRDDWIIEDFRVTSVPRSVCAFTLASLPSQEQMASRCCPSEDFAGVGKVGYGGGLVPSCGRLKHGGLRVSPTVSAPDSHVSGYSRKLQLCTLTGNEGGKAYTANALLCSPCR